MAFSVSYHDLLHKNIRHIYSNLPSNVRFRADPEPGVTLNPHDGCLTANRKLPPPSYVMPERLYRRLWAYSTEYRSPMPRAPAFRHVSPDEANVIVNRVNRRMKTNRRRRGSYYGDEEDEQYESYGGNAAYSQSASRCSSPVSCTSTSCRRCGSPQEMEALTERLMRPTTAWNIRSDLREGSTLDPVEVVTHRSARRPGVKSARL